MTIDLMDTIGPIFLEKAESLTYMFGDPVDPEYMPRHESEWSRTSIRFTGTRNGTLSLVVPTEVCGEIAANIMGIDREEIGEDAGADALKELLNVVSGHIVPSIQEGDKDFILSIPGLDEMDGPSCFELIRRPGTVCFILDSKPVILSLELDG